MTELKHVKELNNDYCRMSELKQASYIGGSTWVEARAGGGGSQPLVVSAGVAAVHMQLDVVAHQVRLDLIKPHVT